MFKYKKLLGIAVVGCIGLGYLIWILLGSSVAYYSTVSELKAKEASVVGQHVRVSGEVTADSIDFNGEELTLNFVIADAEASMPVFYKGVVPDAFKENVQVVCEGKLDSTGVFQASTLMTKCPSKYEPSQ